jgi:hypothetical protein
MIDRDRTIVALTSERVEALLRTALRARQAGKQREARALLRTLAAHQPDVLQVWLVLAIVAETREEQRAALERALALDPHNPLARRGLARFGTTNGAPATPGYPGGNAPVAATAPEPARSSSAAATTKGVRAAALARAPQLLPTTRSHHARDIRWPLYLVITVATVAVLVAAIVLRGPGASSIQQATATPALLGAAPALPRPTVAAGTAQPAVFATAAPPRATPRPTAPAPSATRPPPPTARPALAPGDVVKQGQWHAVLIRPDYIVRLDGAIGSLQPKGRFVLALLAVGNDGLAPARIPANLFALVDAQGNRYLPLPAASTAYLSSYGRGQRGDLSMEDPIPADGGNKSVPLIFDVPQRAQDLYLFVGEIPAGWVVKE